MLRLNNQAILELTYSLLPRMFERPQKGIINVSSIAGFQPFIGERLLRNQGVPDHVLFIPGPRVTRHRSNRPLEPS
jgi:hypothetical protein